MFLTVTPESERESADSTELCDCEVSQTPEPLEANELEAICTERDELQATVNILPQEKADLQEQLQVLQQALEASKARVN